MSELSTPHSSLSISSSGSDSNSSSDSSSNESNKKQLVNKNDVVGSVHANVNNDVNMNANYSALNSNQSRRTNSNSNSNSNSNNPNQSFQEFYDEENEQINEQVDLMTEDERRQQLNRLLDESSDLNNDSNDSSQEVQIDFGLQDEEGVGIRNMAEYAESRSAGNLEVLHPDVPFDVSADTLSSEDGNQDDHCNVLDHNESKRHVQMNKIGSSFSDEVENAHIADKYQVSPQSHHQEHTHNGSGSDHEHSIIANDEENQDPEPEPNQPLHNKSLELSDDSSSSSSSSSGSSSLDSSTIENENVTSKQQEQIQEHLTVPIAISKSRSVENASEFDRAMTDVIHSESAVKIVSYNGSSQERDLDNANDGQSQPPDIASPLSTTIEQVHTIDDEDDAMDTAFEISLSTSQSYEGADPSKPHNTTEVDQMNMGAPIPPPLDSVTLDSISRVTGKGKGMSSVTGMSQTISGSVATSSVISQSSTGAKSLAQQIKQSIGETQSKSLARNTAKGSSPSNTSTNARNPQVPISVSTTPTTTRIRPKSNDLATGSLPDVLTTVRDKIDGLFENERRAEWNDEDEKAQQNREQLRRAFQQSVSAAVLVSLAHKRYERRRLAAMEIEKVVRALVQNRELERVKGILLLLSDDYVRSTNEEARKGGVVAMAACAIGMKKAHEMPGLAVKTNECTDLILASVVHACQDNAQRVRYYATESLFNVIKVLPSLAVDHFFILFEILRSLWADVDVDVTTGAKLLDKKLQGIIIAAINSGQFDADSCVPLFARFLHMRNKPTKRLTLMWLQAFAEKLLGAPLLEFLHLFLYDVFTMLADPNNNIRQLALVFLNLMLPKLLMKNEDFEDSGTQQKVDFDKILQSLVTTMESPDPFVRKVAMFWVSRIVQAHMGGDKFRNANGEMKRSNSQLHAASISVRNALEHVLPGLLLSIGDTFQNRSSVKDTFLPEQTTHYLAEQTNRCLQNDVRQEAHSYIPHLGGFVVALREELDTRGGLSSKTRSAKEREPYRKDVKPDGSGIESTGWFRTSEEDAEDGESIGHENILSRLCALEWIVLLFECVVPDSLKDEYAEEFITPVIRLLEDAPELIVLKSIEVLSKITASKGQEFEKVPALSQHSTKNILFQEKNRADESDDLQSHPMTDANATYALGILHLEEKGRLSRSREVFAALIKSHAKYPSSLSSLSRIIRHMCSLQPPEFIFVSFGLELNVFVIKMMQNRSKIMEVEGPDSKKLRHENARVSKDLNFTAKFAQVLSNVLLTCQETERLRNHLKGCIAMKGKSTKDERKAQMFHILLKTFAHDPVAAISLCLWCGAFRTASSYIHKIDPLDLDLNFYMEIDQLIEFIERPLFRDLHLSMLECDENPGLEGSGSMLYRVLKSILMLLPQSTSYNILQQRLLSVARFRQCAVHLEGMSNVDIKGTTAEIFVHRILEVRQLHCDAKWRSIRSESLEPANVPVFNGVDSDAARRNWLGYKNKIEEEQGRKKYRHQQGASTETENGSAKYHGFHREGEISPDDRDIEIDTNEVAEDLVKNNSNDDDSNDNESSDGDADDQEWKESWAKGSNSDSDTNSVSE